VIYYITCKVIFFDFPMVFTQVEDFAITLRALVRHEACVVNINNLNHLMDERAIQPNLSFRLKIT